MKNLLTTLLIAIILTMAVSITANPLATAYWTGKVKYVTTITQQTAVQCEYQYADQKFWMTFVASVCPSTVEVR